MLGPYQRQGFVYTNNGSHRGHNVSALELPDGTYAVVVSETVPFTIYRSTSLDGPWTACTARSRPTVVNAGTDANYASNVSLVPAPRRQIPDRAAPRAHRDRGHPVWSLQDAEAHVDLSRGQSPDLDSIYPQRTSIPGVSNPTYAWEEDPHIWRSGGIYHVIYSGSGDRVGWHLYSADGITNWTDNGYGWSPREYQKIFGYEGSTTKTQWYKMERPGVVLEDGHPTHITWAVSDVDKDNRSRAIPITVARSSWCRSTGSRSTTTLVRAAAAAAEAAAAARLGPAGSGSGGAAGSGGQAGGAGSGGRGGGAGGVAGPAGRPVEPAAAVVGVTRAVQEAPAALALAV